MDNIQDRDKRSSENSHDLWREFNATERTDTTTSAALVRVAEDRPSCWAGSARPCREKFGEMPETDDDDDFVLAHGPGRVGSRAPTSLPSPSWRGSRAGCTRGRE